MAAMCAFSLKYAVNEDAILSTTPHEKVWLLIEYFKMNT
jgi:hypothetical protein